MKKLLFCFLILITACSTSKDVTSDGGFTAYGIDFRPYTAEDFLITTQAPRGDYYTIGLIQVNLSPEVTRTTISRYNEANNGLVEGFIGQKAYNGGKLEYYLVEVLDVQKAIDEIYNISSEWGANAIFNLDIIRTTNTDIVTKDEIEVSGLAVVVE